MKVKQVVVAVLLLFISILETVLSLHDKTQDGFDLEGKIKVRSMLKDYLQELPDIMGHGGDPKAQIYADRFSHKRAGIKSTSGDKVIEEDGLVGVLFKPECRVKEVKESSKDNNFDDYYTKIERRKTTMVEMVEKKKKEGKTLIGVGVGYICQDVIQHWLLRGIANKLTKDEDRIVHLSVVLTFTMEMTADNKRTISTVMGNVGTTVPSVKSSLEYNIIGQLWATIYANLPAGDTPPTFQSTPKEIWVTPYEPCTLQAACGKIQDFITKELTKFKGNFLVSAVWIPRRHYSYNPENDSLSIRANKDGHGTLIIATKFPLDFHETEEDALFQTVLKHSGKTSSATRCALAKEVTRLRLQRLSPIGDEISNRLDPIIESPAFARIVSFRVRAGVLDAQNIADLCANFIKTEFAAIGDKIRGFAFRRRMERNPKTNEVISLTLMAAIIDEEVLGLKLSEVSLYAWAIETAIDYAKYGTNLHLKSDFEQPFRRSFVLDQKQSKAVAQKNKALDEAKLDLAHFRQKYKQGSVTIAIVSDSSSAGSNNQSTLYSIAIIFMAAGSKGSERYFDSRLLETVSPLQDKTNDGYDREGRIEGSRARSASIFD